MKTGILVTSISNFGQKGFYNAQEVGLAKALEESFDEVKIYKLVSSDQEKKTEAIEGCRNISIMFLPAKNFGINGIMDVSVLDTTLDALVYFSDTQFSVPKVYKWAVKNNVVLLPYIGVIESHSTSKVKKLMVDWFFKRNLSVYKKCHCLVKTPQVESDLRKRGVDSITVTPVGLDLSLLRKDYADYSIADLKKKYGYTSNEKILLFIGRLIDEKQPVRMIDIFAELVKEDENYRLFMVGTGELKGDVVNTIQKYGVDKKVKLIDRIPNSDIWELYRLADCFVNLNQQEIFGMAILEAMYYECKVVAWKASGPELIITNEIDGYLVDSDSGLIKAIQTNNFDGSKAHHKILDSFVWDSTASKIKEMVITNRKS